MCSDRQYDFCSSCTVHAWLNVCLHMTQCLVVDGNSELTMVITPAGRGTIHRLGPSLFFSMHTVTYDACK